MKKIKENKKCELCNNDFLADKNSSKFCSTKCAQYNRVKKYNIKNCIICGGDIEKRKNQSLNDYSKAKYCSPECNYTKKAWNKGLTKDDPRVLSYVLNNKTQYKKGESKKEKNRNWKGDEASYAAKHIWVSSNYGKASKCEICPAVTKRYHWSNISNNYSRDIKDWVQLCPSCHKKFDLYKKDNTKYEKYACVYNSALEVKK